MEMHNGMGAGMGVAMMVIWALVVITLLLAIVALVKYLRS